MRYFEVNMLELLSPAGSPEAVIAAVQSGADTIYMGYGVTAAGKGENDAGFSPEEFVHALRYCRVRGCAAVIVMSDLITDGAMERAVQRAVFAARQGADAILVQDLGLISAIRAAVPDMPLWGGVRLGVHNVAGARAAADLGLVRVTLAPELTLDQIKTIAQGASIETIVYVHGSQCFAHSGRCYMSAMQNRHRSDSVGACAEPCRSRFSLGGRLDDRPMSMKDVCLIDHLRELEEAGVTCAAIEGRSRRPEYVAFATRMYARAIREGVLPNQEERVWLRDVWSPGGLTDGALTGEKGPSLMAETGVPDRSAGRVIADVRKSYMDKELRRVPLRFYVVMQQGRQAQFAAEDNRGHRAVYQGYVPIDLGREGISAGRVEDLLYRTGGTPFTVEEVRCAIDPHMDYPDEAVETARRELLSAIADQGRDPAPRREGKLLAKPEPVARPDAPAFIVQVTAAAQLTPELAKCRPEYLYVPAQVLAGDCPGLEAFVKAGSVIAAVLPPVVTDNELPELKGLLQAVRERGVQQALLGSMGLIRPAREAGMTLRGDCGLNVTNSWTLAIMKLCGFASVTASFQLSAAQIRGLSKTCDTEMLIYGRVPVMISDRCVIRNSSGRCSCGTPTNMSDEFGNVYPVMKAFGCRNQVFDAKKLFLADRPELYTQADLWGARLSFTSESPRECVDVARRCRGLSDYRPNNLSRGLYPKGAL